MTDNQHWIYQGRQSHGWFGSGTAPDKSSNEDFASAGSLFSPAQIAQRIDYAAFSLVGHVSPRDRGRSAVNFDASARDRLKTVIAAWYGASELSRDAFRARFLDPYTSDQIVDRLRSAAFGMVKARTYETLNAAGKDLADAVQQIGLDRWPRYLADADRKAVAAVSDGAIPDVVKVGSGDTFVGGIIVGGLIVGAILGSSSTVLKLPKTALNPPSPTVVEAVAVPPRKDGETPDDILKPGGRLVGQPGSNSDVREIPGGEAAADDLFDSLTKGGTDITPPGYTGKVIRLPDGSVISYRPTSKSGPPTIDVNTSSLKIRKLKFPGENR